MKKANTSAGFTLVEMLVVLAIMATTLAISLPYTQKSGDQRILESTAQIIAARLRQTQAASVSSNNEGLLKIDLKNSMLLEPKYMLPDGTSLQIETAQDQIRDDRASILFFADGGSTGGKITLSKGKSHIELAINWLDGAVVLSNVKAP
jgi:general secretion pathway protein H